MQGLLEILGLPYTHSGVAAAAIAMHKEQTKTVLRAAGDIFGTKPHGYHKRGPGCPRSAATLCGQADIGGLQRRRRDRDG